MRNYGNRGWREGGREEGQKAVNLGAWLVSSHTYMYVHASTYIYDIVRHGV